MASELKAILKEFFTAETQRMKAQRFAEISRRFSALTLRLGGKSIAFNSLPRNEKKPEDFIKPAEKIIKGERRV